MLRVNPTTLSSYQLFLDDDVAWMTEERLLGQISEDFTGNERTEFGSDFHQALEEGTDKVNREFTPEQIHHINLYRREYGSFIIPENRITIMIDGVLISMRIDAILPGDTIHEYKTTGSLNIKTIRPMYLSSPQNKIYMMATGKDICDYFIYSIGSKFDKCKLNRYTVRRYIGMENDMTALVRSFKFFIQKHSLEKRFTHKE